MPLWLGAKSRRFLLINVISFCVTQREITLVLLIYDTFITADTGLSPMDPRWIGAWWLGFIIFGGAALVIGIPLLFFPKSLVTRHAKTKALKKHSFWIKFKGTYRGVVLFSVSDDAID